jgi:hypothetical protein
MPTQVNISREKDDPICQRASVGGFPEKGFYLVYRFGPEGGKAKDIIRMLETVLTALRYAPELPVEEKERPEDTSN